MATDMNLLMGEVIENPEGQTRNVEQLLHGFLSALLKEQTVPLPKEAQPVAAPEQVQINEQEVSPKMTRISAKMSGGI